MGKVQSKDTKRMPLKKADEFASIVTEQLLHTVDFFLECGSLRREKPYVADIDIVAIPKNRAMFDAAIQTLNGLEQILWNGDRKLTIVVKSVQIDFMFAKSGSELPAMVLHFTGSKESNIRLRARAKSLGYRLNEYGLWNGDKRISCKIERDIYERLGLDYQLPKDRN